MRNKTVHVKGRFQADTENVRHDIRSMLLTMLESAFAEKFEISHTFLTIPDSPTVHFVINLYDSRCCVEPSENIAEARIMESVLNTVYKTFSERHMLTEGSLWSITAEDIGHYYYDGERIHFGWEGELTDWEDYQ